MLGPFGGVLFAVIDICSSLKIYLFSLTVKLFLIIKKEKGQMGTKNLQKQIKEIIATLGWTQNQLARVIYTELNDCDVESEILKFEGKLKKALYRSTTKPELLNSYLSIISLHPDFEKLDKVKFSYKSTGFLSDEVERKMRIISQSLDKTLE
ncbi:hypothetical protein K5N70_004491 [Vibrio vulnificus]|uniref:hypothetical protein n=1 Tax=Vibrio metoecus TaxID=1481663 RepID=UPI0015962494|nr:hypothetical protein [Vibrio metoecus]EHZ2746829.1 hypothetical protein [Vibrio vulnificus]